MFTDHWLVLKFWKYADCVDGLCGQLLLERWKGEEKHKMQFKFNSLLPCQKAYQRKKLNLYPFILSLSFCWAFFFFLKKYMISEMSSLSIRWEQVTHYTCVDWLHAPSQSFKLNRMKWKCWHNYSSLSSDKTCQCLPTKLDLESRRRAVIQKQTEDD